MNEHDDISDVSACCWEQFSRNIAIIGIHI